MDRRLTLARDPMECTYSRFLHTHCLYASIDELHRQIEEFCLESNGIDSETKIISSHSPLTISSWFGWRLGPNLVRLYPHSSLNRRLRCDESFLTFIEKRNRPYLLLIYNGPYVFGPYFYCSKSKK